MQIQTNSFEDIDKIMRTLVNEISKSTNGHFNIIIDFKVKDNNSESEPMVNNANDIDQTITLMLRNLGIPAHILGYTYLKDAIKICIENKDMLQSVTKLLYPAIAKKNSTTSSRAERAIRHLIEVAWERGNVDIINNLLGYTVNSRKGKPTNSEFIALLTEEIKLKSLG